MRIVVFGTGGIGGYYGGRLAQAGEDVTFVARGEHLRAIQASGLRVESVKGDFAIQPAKAVRDVSDLGPVDAVLVGVKTWQLAETAEAIRPVLGPETAVVPFQNGVEATMELASMLGPEHVLVGIARIFSFIGEPGLIRHIGGPASIAFGERDNRPSDRVAALRTAFERAKGLALETPEDINHALWEKFLFVVACGSVGAISRMPFGVFRSVSSTRQMLLGAMGEIRDLARAHGVFLPHDVIERNMEFVDAQLPVGTTSLQRDLAEGRRSELDAWTGAVVRLGRERGVPTPIHSFIYDALLPTELKARDEIV